LTKHSYRSLVLRGRLEVLEISAFVPRQRLRRQNAASPQAVPHHD
jgi:hypothetical protein